jgi:hypothetical protein
VPWPFTFAKTPLLSKHTALACPKGIQDHRTSSLITFPAQLSERLPPHRRAASGPLEASSALKLHQEFGPVLTPPTDLYYSRNVIDGFATPGHALSDAKTTCWQLGVAEFASRVPRDVPWRLHAVRHALHGVIECHGGRCSMGEMWVSDGVYKGGEGAVV